MIKIKSKKAQNLSIGKIIAIIAAVFVLAVVLLSVFGISSSRIIPFFKNIFTFQGEYPKIDEIEIVGYELINAEAKYYDGTSWLAFSNTGKGIALLNGKKAEGEKVKQAFENYYFQKRGVKKISLGNDLYGYIMEIVLNPDKPPESGFIKPDQSKTGKKGDVIMYLRSESAINPGTYGTFYFRLDGTVSYVQINKGYDDVVASILANNADPLYLNEIPNYRDSILRGNENAKAMSIIYNEKEIKVCVERNAGHLMTRLNIEVSGDEECK